MNQPNHYLKQTEKLLKATDVAEKLNISRAFAYKLMKQGDIPTVQIGDSRRVRPSDLQHYILQNTVSSISEK
jgi:excisionase family DNA binding protein